MVMMGIYGKTMKELSQQAKVGSVAYLYKDTSAEVMTDRRVAVII